MHKAYREFKQLVEAEKLSVTYIDTAARTVSAALFRSLTTVHDASGDEPFKYGSNFEATIEFLLDQARKAGISHASVSQPTTLVVQELARALPVEDWANWMPLVKNFVVTVRDPHVQLWSQMRRFANDVFYHQQGADGLHETQVRSMAEQVGHSWERGGTVETLNFPGNFNRTAWKDLQGHSMALEDHLRDHPQKQLMVIEGFLLQADPESIMAEVLTRLKITFDTTTLARVVSPWSPETVQYLKEGINESDAACRARSARTTGYEPPLEETPPLNTFPVSLQRHLVHTAMPIYVDFVYRPERIGPKTPQALLRVLKMEVNGVACIDRNPVTAYALMSSLVDDEHNAAARRTRAVTLADLRHKFPAHRDVFHLIDQQGNATRDGLSAASTPPLTFGW